MSKGWPHLPLLSQVQQQGPRSEQRQPGLELALYSHTGCQPCKWQLHSPFHNVGPFMTLLKHKKHSQLIGCLEIGWPNCNVIPLDSNIKNTYHFVILFCLHFLLSSIASKSISVARAEGYTIGHQGLKVCWCSSVPCFTCHGTRK